MNTLEPIVVLTPLIAGIINVLAHLGINHLYRSEKQMRILLAGFLLGFVLLLYLTGFVFINPRYALWEILILIGYSGVIYLGLSFCYFTFINLNLASLRIRLLKEIHQSKTGALTTSEILNKYDSNAVVNARLHRLVKGGQLQIDHGVYKLGPNPTFKYLFIIMDALKWFVLRRRIEKLS